MYIALFSAVTLNFHGWKLIFSQFSDKYKKIAQAFSGVFDFKVRPYGKFA